MPLFSCCKHAENEHQVNYNSSHTPDYEQSRIKLLDSIQKLNTDYAFPKLHSQGRIYPLDYNTLMESEDPYMIKHIVVEHLRNNCQKVEERLINELESNAQLVMLLKKSHGKK